jgi:hypothetical protein
MVEQLWMVTHKRYKTVIMVLHAIETKPQLLLDVKKDAHCPCFKPKHMKCFPHSAFFYYNGTVMLHFKTYGGTRNVH